MLQSRSVIPFVFFLRKCGLKKNNMKECNDGRKKLGELITSSRKKYKMTQLELGKILNVSDKTISNWERGAGYPDIRLIMPLADALHVDVRDILKGIDR